MYLKPQHVKWYDTGRYISNKVNIQSSIPFIQKMLSEKFKNEYNDQVCYPNILLQQGVPQDIKDKVETEFNISYVKNEEGYIIDIQDDIRIYSESQRGLFYGSIVLLQMVENQYIKEALVYDYPVCPVRGVKVYLPGKDNIEFFKQFVDMACYYKYNTIMIEVGGAMEYKKHPEINEGWVDYCKEMSEYSEKTWEIQERTFGWQKNSMHVENGEGGYLSQDVVRDLVQYCKERMLNVIAEVPSLSHCDYLLINHPELREREEDPYPDTYCPSNPKSYELLFDVLDEVIDVFDPEIINIGHDEYYSIGLCEKCRDKKPEELFANDIAKIQSYLAGKGIKTMIWGEKLLNASLNGKPQGGADKPLYHPKTGEYTETIPATYKAIDLVSKDLKILHWYWGIDATYEEEYLKRGLEVTYGNFSGPGFPDWKKRIARGVKGGIMSNWSTLKEENLQRNQFFFNMVYSARMFWDLSYEDSHYEAIRDAAFQELYRYKHQDILKLQDSNSILTSIQYIKVLHTTDRRIEYKAFVDGSFIEKDVYQIGEYVLVYEDDTEIRLPIIYGENISNKDVYWTRALSKNQDSYNFDRLLSEVTLTTLPTRIDDTTYYECIFANPYPEKRIKGIYLKKSSPTGYEIYIKDIMFI